MFQNGYFCLQVVVFRFFLMLKTQKLVNRSLKTVLVIYDDGATKYWFIHWMIS